MSGRWNIRTVTAAAIVAGMLVVTSACGVAGRYAPSQATAGTVLRGFVFPVAGSVSYSDTFGAARSGGRTHEGQDLMGVKHTPLVAAADGTVTSLTWSTTGLSGNSLTITDADGWRYVYIHLNNDTPGTDDGSNVYERAFADGIVRGQRVVAGEVVGFLGDSGNAEASGAHLHFELHRPDGAVVNAYGSLRAARKSVRTEADRIAAAPTGVIDGASRSGDGSVRLAGWAVDAAVNDPVKVTAYVSGNPTVSTTASASRPDLAAVLPGRGTLHGFTLSGVTAPPGATVCVVAHSVRGGGSTRIGCLLAPA